MTLFAELPQLSPHERARMSQRAEQFTQAWRHEPLENLPVAMAAYLPSVDHPLRGLALQDLLLADLKNRWARGNTVLLEQYLEIFPELNGRDGFCAQLLFEEYRIRRVYDASVSVDEYATRFPTQYAELQKMLGAADNESRPKSQTMHVASSSSRDSQTVAVGGGFRLINRLGRGSYGEVWRAEAPGGVEIALKMVAWPLSHKASQSELRALELIKQLRHPFLLQVQAYWRVDDQLIMATELADGNLEDHERKCRERGLPGIPVEELLSFMRETAEALDYLHREGRLHRDVKPANILVVNGHAKLGDFGLARLFKPDQLDVTATLGGTALYMAPEVWSNRVGPRSDQYSLAATYVELRLLRPLYDAHSQFEVMQQHLSARPELSGLTAEEQAVLQKALAKKPEDRFATCMEFATALSAALEQKPQPASATQSSIGARRVLVVALLLLAASAASVAWFVWLRPKSPALIASPQLTVRAGSTEKLDVYLANAPTDSVGQLSVTHVPGDVTVRLDPQVTAGHNAKIEFTPSLLSPAAAYDIELVAHLGNQRLSHTMKLSVEALTPTLPTGYESHANAELRGNEFDQRVHWSKIVPQGRESPVFVLIPATRASDPPTFYMMEDKVTNGQFLEFADANPTLVTQQDWRQGVILKSSDAASVSSTPRSVEASPRYPVVSVTVDDACRFAEFWKGRLPTQQQWDKAAGRFDHTSDARGPYAVDWSEDDSQGIAVQRNDLGPAEAGVSAKDISMFGCRDMAGNGREWTRDLVDGQTAPLPQADGFRVVFLRGRSFRDPSPLVFGELEDVSDSAGYTEHFDDLGFRVVLELP